jgi:hypothetical protein
MRGVAAMLGTVITLAISAAAVTAMTVDLRDVASRATAREVAMHQELDRVWLGGELTPIVVQAAPLGQVAERAAVRPAPRPRSIPRTTTVRIG